MYMPVHACKWRSESNSWELVPSNHLDARDETQVIRLGDSRLYLMSHLAHPGLSFKAIFQLNNVFLAFLFFSSIEVSILKLIFPVIVSAN